MRRIGFATLAAVMVAGSATAGDVGVIKGPGWWGPIYFDYVRNPTVMGGVNTLGGVYTTGSVYTLGGVPEGAVRGGPMAGAAADAGPAAASASAQQAAQMSAVIPAGADRATLLRLRQALAEEAARRGLR